MHILILEGEASSSAGGAESSMRKFCEALAKDHDLSIAYAASGDLVEDEELRRLYVNALELGIPFPTIRSVPQFILAAWRLARFIDRESVDIVLTHQVHVSPLMRIVKWFVDTQFSIYFKWVCTAPVGFKVLWGNGSIDQSAAVSNFVADYWAARGVKPQPATVPEGIALASNSVTQTETARADIGFAGRLVPEKGLELLISALPDIRRGVPNARLRVAGRFNADELGSQYRRRVEALIASHDLGEHVLFDGFRSPLEDWLVQRALVVIPSTCDDAQPLVMMQSMACETPSIAS